MSYRLKVKADAQGNLDDLPLDAETLKGHTVETTGISSNANTIPLTSQVKTYVDSKTGTVTSVRVQAGTGLNSSTSTAQSSTLDTTISIASGYKLPTTTEWDGMQPTLVSGTSIKTINSTSLLGSGNIAVQATLVSGGNIKTINNQSLLGSGNITITGGSSSIYLHLIEVYYRNSGLSMYFRIFSSKSTAYSLSEIRTLFESNKLGNLSVVYNRSSGTINNENGYVANDTSDYCLKFRFTSSATVSWWDYQDSVSSLDIDDSVYTL